MYTDADGKKYTEEEANNVIPKNTPYCYTYIGRTEKGIKTKTCPFWNCNKDKPSQENGMCHLTNTNDWEDDGFGLLWDQCKECGINEEEIS